MNLLQILLIAWWRIKVCTIFFAGGFDGLTENIFKELGVFDFNVEHMKQSLIEDRYYNNTSFKVGNTLLDLLLMGFS